MKWCIVHLSIEKHFNLHFSSLSALSIYIHLFKDTIHYEFFPNHWATPEGLLLKAEWRFPHTLQSWEENLTEDQLKTLSAMSGKPVQSSTCNTTEKLLMLQSLHVILIQGETSMPVAISYMYNPCTRYHRIV